MRVVAVAALAVVILTRPSPFHVGPVYVTERTTDVESTLGRPRTIDYCPDPGTDADHCLAKLEYTDGNNLLTLELDGDRAKVVGVTIELGRDGPRATRSDVKFSAFENWTWYDVPITEIPKKQLKGWIHTPSRPTKDCHDVFDGRKYDGSELVTTYTCASGTDHVATFSTGYADP